ncbi:MAG: PepSY domain-containing protein [Bacteroidia bacterium]|nr:PepSY domain-containing protein [Bacteroidia bacterium]
MADTAHRKQQARLLRIFRTWHRSTGAMLFVFFFVVSVTGLLLGWKKHSGDLLLAASRTGVSSDLKDWLPLDSLHAIACAVFRDSVSADASLELDRIDVRKDKGMVKFIFTDGFWGIQLDGTTGAVLHIERRRSDFIEKIHDGSLLDLWAGTRSGQIKLVYTTLMGLALLLFTVTGFWLWYGPIRMRRQRRS